MEENEEEAEIKKKKGIGWNQKPDFQVMSDFGDSEHTDEHIRERRTSVETTST